MSKFQGLLQARKQKHSTISTTQKSSNPTLQNVQPRVGRPRAKRSDPEYQQVTAYIRRDTYTAARKLLLDEGREFSELVEDLVRQWTKTNSKV